MQKTNGRPIGWFMLFAILVILHSGCARTSGPKSKLIMSGATELHTPQAKQTLRAEVERLLDYSESEIKATCANIEAQTQDRSVLAAALRWRINFVETANAIIVDEPFVVLLHTWALAIRQRQYLERGEGKNLFRDLQPLAIESAVRIHRRTEEVAREQISEDRIAKIVRLVEKFARENPVQRVFAFEVEKELSQSERKNLFTWITGLPGQLAAGGRDALDPTSTLAKSVDAATELFKDYPALLRWEAQLLALETQQLPSIQTTVKSIEDLSESSVRLATVSETLPQALREQVQIALDDVIAQQPEIRKTLDDAQRTVDTTKEALESAERVSKTIERSVDAVTRAGEVWQTTAEAVTETVNEIQQLRAPRVRVEKSTDGEPDSTKSRFDINDYARTAEAILEASEKLRELLADIGALLDGDTVEKNISQVDSLTTNALSQTAAETRGIIDHAAWRAVQLLGLCFGLAIGYRLLMRRFGGP